MIRVALQLGLWSIERLQLSNGAWKFQIGRLLKNRLAYMRLNAAWMYLALSRLQLLTEAAEKP